MQIAGRRWIQQLLLELHHHVRLVRSLRQIPHLGTSVLRMQLYCSAARLGRCVCIGCFHVGEPARMDVWSGRHGWILETRFTAYTLIHLFYRSEQILALNDCRGTTTATVPLLTCLIPLVHFRILINFLLDVLLLDLSLRPTQWPVTTQRSRTTS